jgi:hypothetical protein
MDAEFDVEFDAEFDVEFHLSDIAYISSAKWTTIQN